MKCRSENATLAQVDDTYELEFLRALVKRFPTDPTSKHFYWIDGVRGNSNHWLRNSDHASLAFFAWGSGEPNNRFGGNVCLALYNHVDFYFADTSCYENGQFICELSDPVNPCIQTTPPPTNSTTGAWVQLG
ncbi:L-selectin-like [Mizuhopecten yessoensis]|uniref:L-selectin n=1 Tax=Mizuhopecten yessoensis TaxID=6573 RepID=A0A210PEH5_MIZYE|nr:L-selectin-like [Mizuhopecten yessoensis]XP_021343603.1 L-selectin-like [Mizuhopecten yessoensis]XP_021343604.1 L-selectin-like [Mizuhopecten yessoensis]OWF34890.1 L-selectin [Mizuhopecten yessoensis]